VPATRYCLPGDVVECEVEGIGILAQSGGAGGRWRRTASPPSNGEEEQGRTPMDRRKFLTGALAAPMAGAFAFIAQGTSLAAVAQHHHDRGLSARAGRPISRRGRWRRRWRKSSASRSWSTTARRGGMLGNAAAARAEPDGHTLLMALSSMTFLPEAERLYDRKPSYELDHLVPIARVLADPGVLCVRSDSPYKTLADLVADAKQRPGQISFRLVRQLRRCACAVRDVPAGGRHQAAARSVSRRRAGAHRVPRQAGRYHRAGAGSDHAACAERRRPAVGELGRQALGRVCRRADHDRARLQGRRVLHLGRLFAPKGTPRR
jgi:hypothetical protein